MKKMKIFILLVLCVMFLSACKPESDHSNPGNTEQNLIDPLFIPWENIYMWAPWDNIDDGAIIIYLIEPTLAPTQDEIDPLNYIICGPSTIVDMGENGVTIWIPGSY